MVVFLLGVVQHQIADVSWHSLGIPQGFLSAMGKVLVSNLTPNTNIYKFQSYPEYGDSQIYL